MAGVLSGLHASDGVGFRQGVIERHHRHVNSGLARLADLMGTHIEVRSAGNYVFDEGGDRYLDCGGYGVFTLGHCHPSVVGAVRHQLERLPLSTRSLVNAEVAAAAEALSAVAPGDLNYVYFGNSGAEATETALKLACLSGKRKLFAMHGGYHGKTIGALGVTGRPAYRAPFASLIPQVEFVPFGDADELDGALARAEGESCVILEPVQAEGGVIVPPTGYLRAVADSCRRRGALLILDEIQTGLGRLGAWWGCDAEQVVPDVLLVGKALSGGIVPISAAVATAEVFEGLNKNPMLHTSTFSGNPLAAAAAHAAIEVIKNENVVVLAQALGETLLAQTKGLCAEHGPRLIREVRGRGLLIGIEFETDFLAGDFMLELMKRKVVVSYSLNAYSVVRLTPPAFLSESDVAWLTGAIRDSLIALDVRYQNFLVQEGR
ncbi:MAG: aminotransferase class III-fold pyridoxal phosphate-dependent enzyme [Acidobacteriota bacterium]|nr:aminotransferase class III-fold pyridoxal phosphate-dependent enzyme [Acidobacteriota bacterium]